MEKLKLNIYNQYKKNIDRYLELEPIDQKEKVDAITLNIRYIIEDINEQIDRYNSKEIDLGIYYQMMIKVDFMISAIEELYKIFLNYKKCKILEEIFKEEDLKEINKFRLLRSLTLAHPLETTRYPEVGYGKENNKWYIDIHPLSPTDRLFDTNNSLKDGDFVLKIKEQGKEYINKEPIYIEKNIFNIAQIVLKYLKNFNELIEKKVSDKIEILKSQKIEINKERLSKEDILKLKSELKKRYPSYIEIIDKEKFNPEDFKRKIEEFLKVGNLEYIQEDQTEESEYIQEEYCSLDNALIVLEIEFKDSNINNLYNEYKESVKKVIIEYAEALQNMSLEEDEEEKLNNAIFPNTEVLKSKNEKNLYRCEKIQSNLLKSNNKSIDKVREKLKEYTYQECECIFNEIEWEIMQLLMLEEDIKEYFPIDIDVNDKMLFAQYCAALYFANKKCITKSE